MPLISNPIRQRIVNQCYWGIGHTADIHYAQTRPIPLKQWKAHELPISTDCSGYATACYYAAGAPDPNGQDYDTTKAMFTGTMLAHLPVIQQSQVRPGDLVVFGAGTGEHVCVVLEPAADLLLASHGGETGPLKIRMSVEQTFHQGQPITYLRGVPKMKRRVLKRRWIVVGDGDKTISHAAGITRWVLRHPRKKRQQAQLHFNRIVAHPKNAANKTTHK